MAEDMEERIFIVPLRKLIDSPRTKRANKAIKLIRNHVAKHMKAEEDHIWIDTPVNETIWKNGRENPPVRIRVKAIKFKDQDLIEVTMPED